MRPSSNPAARDLRYKAGGCQTTKDLLAIGNPTHNQHREMLRRNARVRMVLQLDASAVSTRMCHFSRSCRAIQMLFLHGVGKPPPVRPKSVPGMPSLSSQVTWDGHPPMHRDRADYGMLAHTPWRNVAVLCFFMAFLVEPSSSTTCSHEAVRVTGHLIQECIGDADRNSLKSCCMYALINRRPHPRSRDGRPSHLRYNCSGQ